MQIIMVDKEHADDILHYGVPGMKWGKRKVRGHAGPGIYFTRKRQLAGDKKDLEYLNKGGHLSVGLTKKRQAAYDKKDKARLEKRIAENEQKLLVPKKEGKSPSWGHDPKSERQQRYEDDNGINPHRPNGTKTSTNANKLLIKNLSKSHPKVAKGMSIIRRIFNNSSTVKY
jgi:hypothetical protein